ncbi:MAG: amidohydrolase family protein [Maribacter sp.]
MKTKEFIQKCSCVLVLLFFFSIGTAQLMPKPAEAQQEPIVLIGGTIHTATGEVIDNGALAFADGKISFVGKASDPAFDASGYNSIEVRGQHLYPGLILPNSLIGIEEISGVPQSNDKFEEGSINPGLKSFYAFDTGSGHIPTLRYTGILMVETIPSGGTISGTSAVMELDGWSWQEAVHKKEAAVHLHWPSSLSRSYDSDTKTTKIKNRGAYENKVQELEALFVAAQSYGKLKNRPSNLKLEALQGLFKGTKALMIHANEAKEIVESIQFAEGMGVQKIGILTSYAALDVADFLKSNNIPVIIPPTYNLPNMDDMDYDAHYSLPRLLSEKGIVVALSHKGMLSTSRNFPFYAGVAAAFGMDKEEALKLVSLNPAKILGIDGRVGSLEVGKDATFFVSMGDALDIMDNSLTHAFIRGKNITLDGPHQELYLRYSKKFGQEH